jgi:hypothetical protein
MLYATDEVNIDDDFNKAMVGVASVWQVLRHSLASDFSQLFAGMKETRTQLCLPSRNCILNIRQKLQ